MKAVHEFFTNARMEDSRFEYSWLHSWMAVRLAGAVRRVESLRGRMGESERQIEGLLSQSFGGGA
jgi:hypothetical protein